MGTSNTAAAAAIDEDVIDVDFAFDDPTPQISSEDSAIDAIDAINRREKASRAKTQASLDKLTDKYRDKYELELSEEDREMMERVAGMTTAVDDDDDDDEFAYAFEGGERDETNVPVEKFVAKEMPRELVTNVRSMPMETFAEEDEEDLEETIEEEEEEAEEEAEEEEDDEDEVEVVMEDEDAEVASDALAAKLAPRDATSSTTSAPPPRQRSTSGTRSTPCARRSNTFALLMKPGPARRINSGPLSASRASRTSTLYEESWKK